MKKAFAIILAALLVAVLSSCTAEAVAADDSWESVFLQFWNEMNMEYAHFESETDLDWDSVYETYLPLFRKLDFSRESDSIKAFGYFKEIAIHIDDCHYLLTVRDAFKNFLFMNPSKERKWENNTERVNSGYPDITFEGSIVSADGLISISPDDDVRLAQYDRDAVEGYYEVTDLIGNSRIEDGDWGKFHSGTTFKASFGYSFKTYENPGSGTVEDKWNNVVKAFDVDGFSYYYGVTEENIFYFYFPYFISYVSTPLSEPLIYKEILSAEDKTALGEKYVKLHDDLWNNFSDRVKYFEGIYNMFEILKSIGRDGKCKINNEPYDIKGVIMDVRSNAGGDNSTLETIFGSFFKDETKFAEAKYKDGYSRYEYGPWLDMSIEKEYCTASEDYRNPFAIITNGNSFSCAELSASIVKNLMKNGAVIGGTTYGATCSKNTRAFYHSGTFLSKSLNIVMTSVETKLRTKDGSYASFEGKGIEPTDGWRVEVDKTSSKDTCFEEALRWVRENSAL